MSVEDNPSTRTHLHLSAHIILLHTYDSVIIIIILFTRCFYYDSRKCCMIVYNAWVFQYVCLYERLKTNFIISNALVNKLV